MRAMMTLALLGPALLGPGTAATADAQQSPKPAPCSITYNAGDSRLRDLIQREGWRFRGYDRLCPLLRRERLGVLMSSSSGVLSGRAYGWVILRLYAIDGFVQGSEARSSTTLSMDASTPVADQVMLDSMNNALEDLTAESDKFVASVRVEQARLRDLYRTPATAPR